MRDAQGAEVEDESSALEGTYHPVLVDRHIEDQHLSHVGAEPDSIQPRCSSQPAQDERMAVS